MIRKWVCVIFALVLLTGIGSPASAAQGSIQVETDAEGLVLYQVGMSEGTGYRLKENFGGGYLTFDDTLSRELAVWLSGRADRAEKLLPEPGGKIFLGLNEGLYLVCCEDAEGFAPFLVIIPWDGYYWEVDVDPSAAPVPQTGDTVGSLILAMAASGAGVMVLARRRKKC